MTQLRLSVCLSLLALATAGDALAQTPFRSRASSAEPRTDLNKLVGLGASLHHVRISGSYYLSDNIKCGAGMTAISIDPLADSVVIDFNGFVIQGASGQTSGDAIDCPAAPTPRSSLVLRGPRIVLFGGNGISVDSVDDLEVTNAFVSQCGGEGVSMRHVRRDGAILSGDFNLCAVGIHALDVSSVSLADVSVSSCDIGIQACAQALQLEGASVQGSSTDGIVLEDSCSPPGVVSPARTARAHHTMVSGCGNDGIELRCTGMSTMELSAADLSVSNCVQHGLYVPVVPAGSPSVGPPTVMLRDSSLCGCGGSGVSSEGSASASGTINHHYAHVDCSRNAQSGISMLGGSSLDGESLSANSNGGSGIELRPTLGKSGRPRMRAVQATGNGLDGLHLEGSTPIIRGSALLEEFHIADNGRDGLSVTNFDARVVDGTIDGSTNDGIHGADCDLEVSNTGISNSGNDGVNALRIKMRNWDGTIYGNHRCGVSATDSKIHVRGVDMAGNAEDGVRLTNSEFEQNLGSLSECGFNGLSATGSTVSLDGTSVGGNLQDGLHLVDTPTTCFHVTVHDNSGDGIDAFAAPTGPGVPVTVSASTLSGNGGYGFASGGKATPKLMEAVVKGHVAGGFVSSSGGTCSPVQVQVSDCTFDSNGGVACDVQNAAGGRLERITVLASVVGIHVGDPSGLGCSSGVRISDCNVIQCSTGYSVDAGGGSLVLRNFASQCGVAPFAVGGGNLFGPIVATQGEMLAATNPNANFVQ